MINVISEELKVMYKGVQGIDIIHLIQYDFFSNQRQKSRALRYCS